MWGFRENAKDANGFPESKKGVYIEEGEGA